jgi:hypothetical protein
MLFLDNILFWCRNNFHVIYFSQQHLRTWSSKMAAALLRVRGGAQAVRVAQRASSSALAVLEAELQGIQAAGTWKSERIITTKQGSAIGVANRPGKVRLARGERGPF